MNAWDCGLEGEEGGMREKEVRMENPPLASWRCMGGVAVETWDDIRLALWGVEQYGPDVILGLRKIGMLSPDDRFEASVTARSILK